ncbi:hypothetical protein SAY87_010797 [Trapa incisa]|uniref:Uncharacterized protein n=1 Tax=Trapa incisa TaxID=236973 RepID=A0AAN7GEP6_9MYRT|nr:hypothetical protein SAY87_010797 [Trapa incisa]
MAGPRPGDRGYSDAPHVHSVKLQAHVKPRSAEFSAVGNKKGPKPSLKDAATSSNKESPAALVSNELKPVNKSPSK